MFQKPKSQANIGESYCQSKNLKVYLIHIDYFVFRFAIHKTLDSTLEILDPLPSQFSRERFQTYLYNFETDCEINSVNLQRRNSDSCGPMVIYYCYTRGVFTCSILANIMAILTITVIIFMSIETILEKLFHLQL